MTWFSCAAARRATFLGIALLVAATASACADSGGGASAAAVGASTTQLAPGPIVVGLDTMTLTVYKSPTCGCCKAWVDHMRENGFKVAAVDTDDLSGIKRRLGVEPAHASCHSATIGHYVVEGHVPAADVRRLLREQPAITGLAVPGMPAGSPGMEGPNPQSYQVLAFVRDKGATVFAVH